MITVTVESADETATEIYTITITRAGGSDSRQATLNSLTVTDTTISSMMPAFEADKAPAASGYVVYVANAVSSVTVAAVATHNAAAAPAITATNQDGTEATVSSGGVVTLDDGGNTTTVKVKVTAQDGFTAETYTINVMRASDSTSTTATLSLLSLTAGGDNLITGFMPNDNSDVTVEAVRVSAATSSVVVNAVTSHTGATVKTSSETQTGDGVNDRFRLKAAGMATEIMVKVTAQDKATILTYMITVTRASNTASADADLRSLGLTMVGGDNDPVDLTPSFVANSGPASGGYSASVGSAIEMVNLNASSSHAGTVVTVMAEGTGASAANDNDATDGEYSGAITLATSGATDIEVKVTAEDGVAEAKYMITVSKETAATSSDLSSLTLDGIDLTPAFDSGTTAYIATASADTATAEVMVTTAHSKADVVIKRS